jgi:hypothetical protein
MRRSRRGPRPGFRPKVLVAACAIVSAASFGTQCVSAVAAGAKRRAVPQEKAPRSQAAQVVRCLHRGGLTHATTNATFLWVGWATHVDGFVYVQLYLNHRAALKEAKFLSREESGLAGSLVISQHISPYTGSPVPRVVKCLHGKMISKPPHKRKQTFTF